MLPRRLALLDHDEAPGEVDRLGYPNSGGSQNLAAAEPRAWEQLQGRLRQVRSVEIAVNAQGLAQFPRAVREIVMTTAPVRHDIETGGGFPAPEQYGMRHPFTPHH